MKIFVLILTVFLIIFMSNSSSYSEGLRGPKIFGLQLGMPMEEAENIIKKICQKQNLKIKNQKILNDESISCDSYDPSVSISWNTSISPHYINKIVFNPSIFNYNGYGYSKDFLDSFKSKYNIPKLEYDENKQNDDDNVFLNVGPKRFNHYYNFEDGWNINFYYGKIELRELTKKSDYKFE